MCGIEYALQAAAVHGALCSGAPQPMGYVAALRIAMLAAGRLDDPALGVLTRGPCAIMAMPAGSSTRSACMRRDGRMLLDGRATVVLPA